VQLNWTALALAFVPLHRSSSQSRRFSRNRMTIQAQEIIIIDQFLNPPL